MEIQILEYVSRSSVIVFLILALVGLHRKWWIPGWYYKDLEQRHEAIKERLEKAVENADAWKEQALTGTSIAQEAIRRGREADRRGRR